VIADPPPTDGFDLSSFIIGYDGDGTNGTGDTWNNPSSISRVAGTDILAMRFGGDCGTDLTGNMDVVNANIQIAGGDGCGFEAGDYLLLTDCEGADLFRASSVSESSGKITIAHAENVNTANFLSKTYQAGSSIFYFKQATYFIGMSANGNPALYYIEDSETNAQEMIENVQDMQILYGLDTNSDSIVDSYQAASGVTDWTRVQAVSVNLLFRSDDQNVTLQPQTVSFNGADVNTGLDADRRLRSIFSTTVTVRNRVP
jgi:type IV pilus assembly protein PilW